MPFIPLLILYSIATLLFAIYSKWQFVDDAGGVSGKWHQWGAYMRTLACITPLLTSFFPIEFVDWLLVTVIQMPWWDVSINIIALHVKALYLGTTAKTDQLKAKKWVIYAIILIAAIVIKILVPFTNQDIRNWLQGL